MKILESITQLIPKAIIKQTWFNSLSPSLNESSVWLYVALWSCLIVQGSIDWALAEKRYKKDLTQQDNWSGQDNEEGKKH